MKMNIIITILFFFITLFNCNNDDKKEISACGIENPLINIEWLNELKNNITNNPDINTAEIILYKKGDSDYFYVSQKITSGHDFPSGRIYNCEGTLMYSCGGNQPIDSCSTFILNAVKIEILWEK